MANIDKNLAAIKQTHINLHTKLIHIVEKTDWFFPMEESDNNLFMVRADNNNVVRGTGKDDAGQVLSIYPFHKDEATTIIGISNGELLYKLCKKKEKGHVVIVYESQLDILKYALNNYDLSKWIKNGSLMFVVEKTNDELQNVIAFIDNSLMIQDWVILVEPYAINKYSVYGKVVKGVQAIINQLRCNTGTVMSAGSIIAKNDIENLPYVIRHEGINALKDCFTDKPAILVSTGPSLSKNIWRLKAIQDQVIIIAVAQALRILLAYDIRPDFICTVDFGEVNLTHFEGLMDSGVPLVALNRTYAPLLKKWKGPKFIASSINPGLEDTIVGLLDDRGQVEQGGSVAHFAFGFGIHLGCNPLVMIGQDLALSDGLSHNPNADSAGKIYIEDGIIRWKVDDPRSNTLNKQEHSMGEAVFVPGYFNEPVLTNIGLASFITAFEDIIKRTAKEKIIINATEGGARIHGTQQMSLKRVISEYTTGHSLDKSIIKDKSSLRQGYIGEITNALSIVEADIKLLDDIIVEADKGLESNKRLAQMAEKKLLKENFFNELKINEKHSLAANELADKNPLVRLYIYNESRQIQSRQLKVKGKPGHLMKHKEDLKTRIHRNKLILAAAKKASEELLQSYKQTQTVLEKYIQTCDEKVLVDQEQYIPSLADAQKYFDQGNWARPYTDALLLGSTKAIEDCWEMRAAVVTAMMEQTANNSDLIDYNELVFQAQEQGRQGDFKKAFELLDQAEKIFPERFEARWGKATAHHHNKEFDKALEYYNQLIKDYPENERLRFERQLVLFDVDAVKGLSEMVTFLSTTENFQYFWRNIGKIYEATDKPHALTAYQLYIEKFPDDIEVQNKIKEMEEDV